MRWPIKFHRPITFRDAPPSYWELITVSISVSLYIEGARAEYLTVGKHAEWDRP